jgi:AraC-like DNA-binding protein
MKEKLKIYKNEDYVQNHVIASSEKTVHGYCESHGHEFFEIEYVLDGRGVYEIDGVGYEIKKNTVFFMTPGCIHTVYAENVKLINLMFSYDYEKDFTDMLFSIPPSIALGEELGGFMFAVLSEIVKVGEENRDYAKSLLKCAIYKLIEVFGGENSKKGVGSGASRYVKEAIFMLHKSFASDISLVSVASQLGLSASYFSDLFHKQTGVTFKSYLDEVRFSYGKKLLKYTSLSVKEIHLACGFVDYANFERRFKKRFGVSPVKYREKSK